MTRYRSHASIGSRVEFPEWRGERHHMLPFTRSAGVPAHVERFQGTVDQMMRDVDVDRDEELYLMIDEADVAPGVAHRRPGLHVDGYWHPRWLLHGGHSPFPAHAPWPPPEPPTPSKKEPPKNRAHEGLLIASNYTAARAFLGEYERDFLGDWRGGACSDDIAKHMSELQLEAGFVFHLDVFTLHESLPVRENVRRTVVRINVPCWAP